LQRITIELSRSIKLRYRDSIHAALITGLRAAGAPEPLVLGLSAAPWTFATQGVSYPGGVSVIRSVTISTSSTELGAHFLKLDPASVRYVSSNGDKPDFTGGTLRVEPLPFHPEQDSLTVGFASPFLISDRVAPTKSYARAVLGIDLSAAFSAGLSRRLGRQVRLQVTPDRLSAATDGAQPVLVRVRKSRGRDLILPALSAVLTLHGKPSDLRDAYLSGLGEKTRYGFGCPLVLA
jgi:CRISPR-associated endoribonuclease Cas6